MATKYADNYTGLYITKPHEKIRMGENAGRKRLLFDIYTLAYAAQVNDEILCGFLPAGCRVIDAKVKISKSLGATGIFSLGAKANLEDAEDADSLIAAVDGGGQAALTGPSAASVGIHKRYESKTQIFLTCTEVMDGAVLDGIISVEVEYVND